MTGASPSQNFVFTGAGASLPPGVKGKAAAKAGQVTFEPGAKDSKEKKGGDGDAAGGLRYVQELLSLEFRCDHLQWGDVLCV